MRIIAGEFRGRKLLGPESDTTRPITDRAKQSLFDVLAPEIDGAVVYDCFAGTGSMGLECLSRGAAHATFFEMDRSAVKRLEQNISTLDVGKRSRVVRTDLFKWFGASREVERRANLIFLDPPYRFLRERADYLQSLAAQVARAHLLDDGTVIFRHDCNDNLKFPLLTQVDERSYGEMKVELLRVTKTGL